MNLSKSLTNLCASISEYMILRRYLELEIFQLDAKFLRYRCEMKSLLISGCFSSTSELVDRKIPQILGVLYNDMNIFGVDLLLTQLEVRVGDQGLANKDLLAGSAELQDSIEWFRVNIIEYINIASGEFRLLPFDFLNSLAIVLDANFKKLIESVRRLSCVIDSSSTRMWTLSTLAGF